ncbi:MAG: phosphoribosyltransferase [Chloroflexi bacterium]|nr:phosphoribosyltransferase [Chloroflexota bacterium]
MVLQTAPLQVLEERPLYRDRYEAGQQIAARLVGYSGGDAIIFAIPRGGVPVGLAVSHHLGLPMDVLVAHKIPIPFNQEAGYGALGDDGSMVLNRPLVKRLGFSDKEIQKQADTVKELVEKRVALFRQNAPFLRLVGRTAILVDDGLVSGYTMAAAVKSLRNRRAGRVVVAVPIAPELAFQMIRTFADEVVCPFVAKTSWFAIANFFQVRQKPSSKEVLTMLSIVRKQR